MNTKGFSIGNIINVGWKRFSDHWGFLLGFFIVTFLINFGGGYLISHISQEYLYGQIALQICLGAVSLLMGMGWIKVCLDVVDEKTPSWTSLFSQWKLIFKYFVASVLFALAIALGLILFFIPGIVWLFKYMFFPYVIIERGLGPIAALKESAKLTEGAKWDLFGWFASLLAILIGAVFFFIFLPLAVAQVLFRSPNINYYISDQNLGIIYALFLGCALILFSLVVGVMSASIYRRLQKNLSPD